MTYPRCYVCSRTGTGQLPDGRGHCGYHSPKRMEEFRTMDRRPALIETDIPIVQRLARRQHGVTVSDIVEVFATNRQRAWQFLQKCARAGYLLKAREERGGCFIYRLGRRPFTAQTYATYRRRRVG